MDKYEAEIKEDTLSLIRWVIAFIGIVTIVFLFKLSPWWLLTILLVGGFRLNDQRED
jgi:hypothetical protein